MMVAVAIVAVTLGVGSGLSRRRDRFLALSLEHAAVAAEALTRRRGGVAVSRATRWRAVGMSTDFKAAPTPPALITGGGGRLRRAASARRFASAGRTGSA
jgi:hypothetical protein